ncbi:MAG: Rpn family recombination-promoting nuclease/putative transposase [Treponema sp.]|nr:Rpn family recombination-promoting nuclease/putative transposase [Treponema sp.]
MKNLISGENPHDSPSKVNRKYKDSVFSLLFSNPEILRELYSAIEGVPISPNVPIDINTLSNVLFMTQINDISFIIDKRLVVLIEHQSTINENIPLRLLEYYTKILNKIVELEKRYQKKLIKIPRPEFIVLYNGSNPYPDNIDLKLSDAFMDIEGLELTDNDILPLELIVRVYNINHGHNPEILKKSENLDGYSFFVDKIREQQKEGFSVDESVTFALEYCIENNKLRDFLIKNGSEVRDMLITEYDRDMDIAVNRREAWEDGREEGREDGLEFTAYNALVEGASIDFVQKITGLDFNTIKEIKQRLNQEEEAF